MAATRIWVYTLDKNISNLQDFYGNDVGDVECGKLYSADPAHPEISNDGSKKLFHATSGIIEMSELNAIAKAHSCLGGGGGTPPGNPTLPKPTNVKVTDLNTGAKTAKVSWTNSPGADEHWLLMSGFPEWKAASNPYTLTNVPLDTDITIQVKAKDSTGANLDSPYTAPVTFKLKPALTDFTLSGTTTGAEGTKGQVTVTPVPSGADLPTLTYTSSHTDMATVDNKGKISFIKGGFFHITVAGGGHSKSIDGEVTNANATTFVSAEALSNGYEILVTMSDDTWYGSVKGDYEVKVNGAVKTIIGASGHGTTTLRLDVTAGDYAKGDTITVSKKVAGHGVAKFTDKPVTNNIA